MTDSLMGRVGPMIHEDTIHYDCHNPECAAANGRAEAARPLPEPQPDPDERYLRLSEVTRLLYDADFEMWERDAAKKGSGLTLDQRDGAAVFRAWMKERIASMDWLGALPDRPEPALVALVGRLLEDLEAHSSTYRRWDSYNALVAEYTVAVVAGPSHDYIRQRLSQPPVPATAHEETDE